MHFSFPIELKRVALHYEPGAESTVPSLDSSADIILHHQHLPGDTSRLTGSRPVTLCIWHNRRVLTLLPVVLLSCLYLPVFTSVVFHCCEASDTQRALLVGHSISKAAFSCSIFLFQKCTTRFGKPLLVYYGYVIRIMGYYRC